MRPPRPTDRRFYLLLADGRRLEGVAWQVSLRDGTTSWWARLDATPDGALLSNDGLRPESVVLALVRRFEIVFCARAVAAGFCMRAGTQ